MSPHQSDFIGEGLEAAPGDEAVDRHSIMEGLQTYFVGLALAVLLTGVSFFLAETHIFWGPSIPVALCVLAVAQMGVHIVFFLHITTGPENTNNVMALAFGVLIVILVLGGSLWIMGHLDHNMMPIDQMMKMQR